MIGWVSDVDGILDEIKYSSYEFLGHGVTEDGKTNEDEYIYKSKDGKFILVINLLDDAWWLFIKRDKQPQLDQFKRVEERTLIDKLKAILTDGYFTFIRAGEEWYWRCDSGDIPDDKVSIRCEEDWAEAELNYILDLLRFSGREAV